MDFLLKASLEQQMPIEIMYLSERNVISRRTISVIRLDPQYIHAYCFTRKQKRTFKRGNILSAAKIRQRKGAQYA
ncbi:hypothetical protein [Domibacillus enclensis]|uniref:WYL domain-containing protein n=1 Tax=Domibacillus enclensis TaxID=1017273 RepID=A0A1N6V1W5_9BACI|nr:hypothetical protein [Domibacillus enclensis]OXS78677.1 hypothetical protein B1B05_08780 [Domibacillus enclensis]SIQ71778.1 hypothetical protein SAMN05443094_103432 [Domibacillus enclensis]